MSKQSQNRNKKWCKYCNEYQSNSYYDAHLDTKKHKANVLKNQIYEEPTQQQIPQKDFIMNPTFLELDNIHEEGNFKNATSIKYTKTFEQDNKDLDISGFNEIITAYHNHFKKPFIMYFGVIVEYKKIIDHEQSSSAGEDDEETITRFYTSHKQNILDLEEEIDFSSQLTELNDRIHEEELQGSGFIFNEISSITLNLGLYKTPIGGTYIKLPVKSNVILNIQNFNDDKCILWSLLAYLHPIKTTNHPCRVSSYKPFINEININHKDIKFPIDDRGIETLQRLNPNIPFNIFEIDCDENNKKIKIKKYLFKSHLDPKGCNLFLYKHHYVLCKNVTVFIGNSKNDRHNFPCLNCLSSYRLDSALKTHQKFCLNHKECIATFPHEDYLEFNNFHFKNRVPFVLYGDFEAWTHKIVTNTAPIKYQQKALCFGIQTVSDYNNLCKSEYKKYYGEDSVEVFVKHVIDLEKKFKQLLNANIPLRITQEQELEFQKEINCYYCNKSLYLQPEGPCEEDGRKPEIIIDKVRDHNHYNGKYRGAAHNKCNLQAKNNKFVPFYFHNLSGYDAHLFFKELIKHNPAKEVKLLANTEEKYISFDFG